jgi:hypothetical protein
MMTFLEYLAETNFRNHLTNGINYRRVLHPDWNVIKADDGAYQLRFSSRPILDFEIVSGSEPIKRLNTHNANWLWLQKVSKDSIRLPNSKELVSMAPHIKRSI